MAFYTRLRVGMRSEVTGGWLGDSFSEEAARTNSGDPTRFLHWASMQGQRPHSQQSSLWTRTLVGAGLPAMTSSRAPPDSRASSLASQLLQGIASVVTRAT